MKMRMRSFRKTSVRMRMKMRMRSFRKTLCEDEDEDEDEEL